MDDDKQRVGVQVAESAAVPSHDEASYVEKQTRTRRLFTPAQLFSFSFMYFVTWQGIGINMYFALVNGGPAAYLFNFIIVSIGVLAQAACLAEMASILPIAGAQYYWTYYFATPKTRLFLTWIQGWVTWLGYLSCLASVLNQMAVVLEATIQINSPDYVNGGWHTTLIVMAILAYVTITNVWLFRAVPVFELVGGIVQLCFFVMILVALWVMSPRNPPGFILTTTVVTGWDKVVSWNVGLLAQAFMFVGFEAVTHMGEETKNSARTTPQAMFWSIAANSALALIMIVTLIICMPPIDEVLSVPSPFVYILVTRTGIRLGTFLSVGIVLVGIGAIMAIFSSVTRITWAWARDGGLPAFFGHVDSSTRVPQRAVLLTCFIVTLLSLLNIGTGAYIALGAVSSLSSFALYFSYAVVLAVTLHARLTDTTTANLNSDTAGDSRFERTYVQHLQTSQWSTGRLGLPLNMFALVYTCYVMIWLPFPTAVPVTAESMNYCGPIFLAVISGAVGAWFLWARKNWAGPNKDVARAVLEKAAATC